MVNWMLLGVCLSCNKGIAPLSSQFIDVQGIRIVVMAWHKTLTQEQLNDKSRHCLTIEGQKILILSHEGQVHAVAQQCPHFKLPLSKAKVSEDGAIVCPFHKSAFDLKSGDVKQWSPWPPAIGTVLGKISRQKTLKVYPTKIEGGEIFVEV